MSSASLKNLYTVRTKWLRKVSSPVSPTWILELRLCGAEGGASPDSGAVYSARKPSTHVATKYLDIVQECSWWWFVNIFECCDFKSSLNFAMSLLFMLIGEQSGHQQSVWNLEPFNVDISHNTLNKIQILTSLAQASVVGLNVFILVWYINCMVNYLNRNSSLIEVDNDQTRGTLEVDSDSSPAHDQLARCAMLWE